MVTLIFRELKAKDIVQFKEKEESVHLKAQSIINEEYEKESDINNDVEKMMDDLERGGESDFQRYKLFPMLKKKIAQQRGFVLEDRWNHFASIIVDGIWKADIVDFTDDDID